MSTASPNIFDSANAVDFLNATFRHRKQRVPSYSLRAWCRAIGFRNPSFLSQILRGERKLTPKIAARISKTLRLEPQARQVFDLLVLKGSAETEAERALYGSLLQGLRPDRGCFRLDLDAFRVVADWYHFALLEMTELKTFRNDPAYLSRRLGGLVSPPQIEDALARMLRLGLLRIDGTGKLLRGKGHPHTGDHRASGAIRRHHRQLIAMAKRALIQQPIEARDIRGSMIALGAPQYAEAVQIVRECHRRLQRLESLGTADQVYQLNTQFFSLTAEAE